MNKFVCAFLDDEAKEGLKLKDIISWKEKGKMSNGYMVVRFSDGSFGLIDIDLGIIKSIQFSTMKELESYLLNKTVDNNEIIILSSEDWTIYVP